MLGEAIWRIHERVLLVQCLDNVRIYFLFSFSISLTFLVTSPGTLSDNIE